MASSKVSDLMTKRLYAVGPDTACAAASRMMIQHRITGAPVLDPEGYPMGMVTLTDLVDPDRPTAETFGFDNYYELENGELHAHGTGRKLDGGRVKELMTKGVISVSALASPRDAARLITDHRVHRLLVMDGDRLLGIVSAVDLVRELLEQV